MKKKLLIAFVILAFGAMCIAIGAFAASDIKLFINGNVVNADVQIVNGSSYVPLRVVSESLGGVVKWDGDARTISITSGTPVATPTPVSAAKSFSVNVNVESGPMKMNISKVTLDPAYLKDKFSQPVNAFILDVTVENTSADTVKWYPDQGTIVLNTKEQITADMFNSDSVGGDFIGKVVKTGKIIFVVKGDLTKVNSASFVVKGPYDSGYKSLGDDKTTDLILN
ncbi:MAG: hypothetical protein JWM44_3513 [Bacilli bacterium]|nr:hypothetical protein [Bacilli bacterium]